MVKFHEYPNWNAVNFVPAAKYDDEEPESMYAEFLEWCADNDCEDVDDIERVAYDKDMPEEERDAAFASLEILAKKFLESKGEPDEIDIENRWDWSPRGW